MYITLSELNLTEDDFDVEIIQIGAPSYNDHFSPFSPRRILGAKVNGCLLNYRTHVNVDLYNDITSVYNIDAENQLEKIIKREIIEKFINSKQYVRKLKLEKIKEKYEK